MIHTHLVVIYLNYFRGPGIFEAAETAPVSSYEKVLGLLFFILGVVLLVIEKTGLEYPFPLDFFPARTR